MQMTWAVHPFFARLLACASIVVSNSIRCVSTAASALLIFTALFAQPAWSQTSYAITDIGTLPGGIFSTPWAINDKGQVAGRSSLGGGTSQGWLYADGTLTGIGTLGGTISQPRDINIHGQIVGISSLSGGGYRGFLYDAGTMKVIGSLGGSFSDALGINDAGQIVGRSASRAFLYSSGIMTDLLPDYASSTATAINNRGQIVGFVTDSNGHRHGFILDNEVLTFLKDLPGYAQVVPWDINDKGQVVGDAMTFDGDSQAFLYSDGHMIPLGTLPGGSQSSASAINDAGQIIGWSSVPGGGRNRPFIYTMPGLMKNLDDLLEPSGWIEPLVFDINNHGQISASGLDVSLGFHSLIFTPIPEPTSLCLLGIGLGAIVVRRRRGSSPSCRCVASR
jgi:probable HAF family extracellular repeat protein